MSAPDVLPLLRELQLAAFRHPVAAQALFRALVAEGRAYAATPEGSAVAERLAHSELVGRGRLAFEVLTLNALDDDPDVVLPSAILDGFAHAVASSSLEELLEGAMSGGTLAGR